MPRPHDRSAPGNIVIDHALVTSSGAQGTGTVEAVAIYEVVDGKIASVSVKFT